MIFSFFLTLLLFFSPPTLLQGKILAPNYDFNQKDLNLIEKSREEIEKIWGRGKMINKKKPEVYLYRKKKTHFTYTLYIQYEKDICVDLYLTFPSYFLHNELLRHLHQELGPQKKYFTHENSALYQWNEGKELVVTYSAACSITCFPLYFSRSKRGLKSTILDFIGTQ